MSTTPTEPPTAGFDQTQAWAGPGGWPTQPPAGPPPRKKHRVRKVILLCLAGFVGFIVLISVVVAATGGSAKKTPVAAASTSAPASTPAAPATTAAAVPSPDGTFQGSCDYTLGSDPAGGTAQATGDIQVDNTGNIGTVDKLTITWPQEGFAPLKMTRTVRLAAGQSRDVQFHRPMTSTEVDNLQNYQMGHDGTGCTYHGTIVSTFGTAR